MISKIPARLTLLSLAALPFQANAQGWFAGGAAGLNQQQDYDVAGGFTVSDDSDAALRLIGGYMISPIQGVVASYVDLGELTYQGPAFGGFRDTFDATGIDVSYIIGWAPGDQERISIFGTVGVFDWDQDVRFTDTTGSFRFRDEGTSFSLGFGAEFNLSADGAHPLGINLAYQLFKDVGDSSNSGVELDRDMISVGVTYRFGQDD
jgi:hypothetical protein